MDGVRQKLQQPGQRRSFQGQTRRTSQQRERLHGEFRLTGSRSAAPFDRWGGWTRWRWGMKQLQIRMAPGPFFGCANRKDGNWVRAFTRLLSSVQPSSSTGSSVSEWNQATGSHCYLSLSIALLFTKKCADIKMPTSAELRATLILCKNVWQCAVYPASIQNKREKADTTWNALAEQKQMDPFIIHLSVSELASQSKRSNLQKASKIVVYRYRSGWCC